MDSTTIPAAKFRPTAIWTLSATFMCRQRRSQHQPSIFQPPNSCKKTSSCSRVQISAHFSILQHPPGLPLTFQPLPEVAADPDTSAFRNLSNLSCSKCCISTMRSLLHIYRTSQIGISIQFQKRIQNRDFNSIPEKNSIPKNLYLAEFPINQASEYHHKIAPKSAKNSKIWAKAMGPRLICIDLKAPPQISPVLRVLSKDQSMTHRQRTVKMVRTLTSIYVINLFIYI